MNFDVMPGAATGIGSLPGIDIQEAIAQTFGELPDLPYLPELPARGPGADMIGRSSAFLVELPVELYAGRWRMASRPGADLRRARDLLERDLDALTVGAGGFAGTLKIQSAGPWTLAASLELALGGALLKDHGVVPDLSASLAEGLRAHVDEVRRRVPGATVVLQLDEPSLPAVLAGLVPTESGLHTYRRVAEPTARDILRSIVDGVGAPVVVHCCASDVPIALIREAGAAGMAFDLSRVGKLDPIGEAVDAGMVLLTGVSSTSTVTIAGSVRQLWRELGFPAERLARQVVVTPACGLATVSPPQARQILSACREAATRLSHEPG